MDTVSNLLNSHLGFAEMLYRFVAALALAALIGLNREMRHKPAGLKTHILVSVAACAFALLSMEIIETTVATHPDVQPDPVRVIEAVVKGVAFLGAGVIIQARGSVIGVTTGASLWVSGAVGAAAGLGHMQVALLGTIFAVLTLTVVRRLERASFKPPNDATSNDSGRK